jgi:iron complex outermembrane receptor protein
VFRQYRDADGDYEGNRLPYAPEYSVAIGRVYRHPNGFFAGVNLTGYGEMFLNKENQFPRDSYAVVNAKTGYETETFDL